MRPLLAIRTTVRTVAGQIDKALQGQPSGIHVVEHDRHQRLHARHTRMRIGIGMILFLARMRRVIGAEDIDHARSRAPPRAPHDGARRERAGSSALGSKPLVAVRRFQRQMMRRHFDGGEGL